MILVDTSIWIDHLAANDETHAKLLAEDQVVLHPFVIGEIALGYLRNRRAIFALLAELPLAKVARDEEVLPLIEQAELVGAGVGYIDAHLLASTRLTPDTTLWTRDRRLRAVAVRLNIAAALPGRQ